MIDSDIKFYLTLLRRWLPFIFLFWALATGIALALALLLPPVYRASASILVESQKIASELAQSTVDINSLEQIQVIQQQLLTRANLLEVAEKFSIFASESGLSATDIVERMTAATELTESQLGATRSDPGTVIFDVAFNASNPGLAARVTNEFVTLILQQNVEIRTGRASDTTQFFQTSVDELGAQLASLESEILQFKNQNADALPESLEFRRSQLTILQERLLQLERDELALQQSKATLEAAMLTQGGEAMLAEQMTPNQQALETLRNQLADQKAILSDKNPTIIALRSRIAALEEVVRNESEAASVVDGAVLPSTLSGQLDQVVARLQAIQDQRTAIDTENQKLQASITRTPEVEIKLNSLVRSYDNVKIQFASAQQKLSEAATGEQLELRQKGERFEVVEQPTVPDQPVSPNRLLIAFGGSALGLMLALGIGFLVEIMNRSVRRPADLIRKLDIQPFATIPYIETRGEVLRGKMSVAAWILALAGGVPAALYLVHYYYMPIDLLVQQTAERLGLDNLFSSFSG